MGRWVFVSVMALLCVSKAGQPRIDKVTGGSRFFSASLSGADLTPCTREATKRANDTGG